LESINAINANFKEEFNEEVSDLLIKEIQRGAEKESDY
jgi:hypothetical protein